MITKTSEASFRTEIAQYQEELDLSVINDQTETKGNRTTKFTETEYNKIKELIPSFNNKYENVLAIEEDKLVYKGNDKTLYKMALEIGLIPEDELLNDEILEELQPFITEWTVNANDSITLPIDGTCNFTVDYGDGTGEYKVTSSTDEDRIHTYTTAGTYIITIKGKCAKLNFNNKSVNNTQKKITKIIQWGATGFTEINFASCENLKGPIPSPSKNSLSKVNSLYAFFKGCKKIDGEIPENLFYGCKSCSSIRTCFSGCESITGIIPQNLFKDCINTESFMYTFENCKQLSGNIPEKLFEKNIKVSNFGYTFSGCQNLSGSIPERLFENNIKTTDFQYTFSGCQNLSGNIPENLFKNCTLASSYLGTFKGCYKLTGSIPEHLFANCPLVKTFRSTFFDCKLLTGNIPQNLFINNTQVNAFEYTFENCKLLTGMAPALWERNNVTSFNECFKNCTSLSNYNDIPSTWK